jgi:aspartyl-tRNA(Asn)/glutamyl-tRNA(Gln) amidotransferase subunit A
MSVPTTSASCQATRGLTSLATALAEGEFTSEALVDACVSAIEERDHRINAVISLDADSAREAARQADRRRAEGRSLGLLDGLPFGVKDNIDVAGFVTTGGLGPRGDAAARKDAQAVARLRAAGAIPLAKLNLHEAALGASNHNAHHGHCYNPLQPGYSPGGSSGGSAAAVAAGYLPFALGTDTMGSLRIPAAYCGVIGYKASFGRIGTGGTLVVSRRLDHVGPIVPLLEDLAPLLAVLETYDPADPWSRDYPEWVDESAEGAALRLSYPGKLDAFGVEPVIRESFYALIEVLRDAGHTLVPVELAGLNLGAFRRAGLLVCEADMLSVSRRWFENDPGAVSEELSALLDWARGKSALDLARADALLDTGARAMAELLNGVDAYLSPTAPQRPFPMTDPVPAGQADLTSLANMAGTPALSLPLPLPAGELPAGLQLVGQRGGDGRLLEIAQRVAADSAGRALNHSIQQHPA